MTTTSTSALPHGPTSSPAPISWPPSQSWDGDDGDWSSFALRLGNPEQTVRVLISTAAPNTKVVKPAGCPPNMPGTSSSMTCAESRGELFDSSLSKTWSGLGNYSLGLDLNLGYDAVSSDGLDTLALGFSNATGGPTLQGQVVAAMASYNFYTGLFGLTNQPSNFTASNDPNNLTDTIPYPSFLTTMKSQKLIPSLSWAYTAGAIYRLKGVFGSLTFGGYDLSRLVPNNVTFNLAPDISRDLVVGLQSITSTAANGSAISLLPDSISAFIDSSLPYIYLPLEACQAFENTFSLVYSDKDKLYTVNDTLHQSLTRQNPNFTFSIGNSRTGGPTVDIVLPYASFDLLASYPRVTNTTRYFPLRRAANDSQYTLGRTFLQEAYLITNYEHSNFSISQARFDDGLPEKLITIPSADLPIPTSHRRVSRNSIIGLTIGLVAFLALVVFLAYLVRKRLRKNTQKDDASKVTGSPRFSQDLKTVTVDGLHEADGNGFFQGELPGDNGKVELLDGSSPSGSGNKILEMPQSPSPAPLYELGTRHTSLATSSLHRQSDRNKNAIYVSTGICRRESNDGSGVLKESPCVETRISSSPGKKSPDLERPLPRRPQWTHEYLNRALPSTPGSDSTQISSTKISSSSPLSANNGVQSLSSRTSLSISESGSTPADAALDKIWKDYDMSWESHRRPEPSLLSSSSTDIRIMMPTDVADKQMHEYLLSSPLSAGNEIVVPPGTPKPRTSSRGRSLMGGPRPRGSFF